MNRLQDTYYTQQVLDGTPPDIGIRQPSPTFSQGEDMKLDFYLSYNGAPVDVSKHIIELNLKKLPQAKTVLWTAKLGAGLFQSPTSGAFYMLIPSEISGYVLPGTYYVDIILTERTGTGEAVKDLRVVLKSFNINVKLTPSSPNPKLTANSVEVIGYDMESGIWTLQFTSTEQTLPLPSPILTIPYSYF